MTSKLNFRILVIVGVIALLDLLIKMWALNTLGFQKELQLIEGVFSIVPIANVRFASEGSTLVTVAQIVLKIVFIIVFFRIQTLPISNGFKWSSAMIVFGWIGNLLDHFFFAAQYGRDGYVHMDYLFDAQFTGSVTSITTIMILAGWIWLFIAAVTKLNDTRKIFMKMAK